MKLLPAGSISGTPKRKTVEIIKEAENYDRGFYTGIFGIIDEEKGFLDSGVIIRYIENQNGEFIYKSGGGITLDSDVVSEYQELINKVYI
jgi:para-aminobenzoate synthetase component 1